MAFNFLYSCVPVLSLKKTIFTLINPSQPGWEVSLLSRDFANRTVGKSGVICE